MRNPGPAPEPRRPRDPVADVVTLLAFLMDGGPVRLLRHGAMPIHAVRELNRRLRPPVPIELAGVRSERQAGRIPLLRRLAGQAGLIAPVGRFLQLTPAAWDWLGWPLVQRWRVLWDTWREDPGWNELGVRDPSALPALRRDLLALLALHSSGEFLPLPVLSQRAEPLLAPHLPPPIPAAEEGETATEQSLRAFLTGPLTWLGAVIPAHSPIPSGVSVTPPHPHTIRVHRDTLQLTPAGAWLLGHPDAPPPTAPPPAPCQVRADLTVWVPRVADAQTRVRLAALAGWVARLPEADLYRVSREAAYRHLQAGGAIDEIIAFLEHSSGQSVPKPARGLLENWAQEYGRLRLRTVTVLEADSRETLRGLLARRSVRRYLTETLSPRIAVVTPGRERQLQHLVFGLGHLPHIELPISQTGPAALTPTEAAYLWLAVQVYRALARHGDLPRCIPQAIVERLEGLRPARLDQGTARPWIAAAETCDAALRYLDPPDEPVSPTVGDEEEENIPPHEESPQRTQLVTQLESAIAAGAVVAMTYYTAGRDAVTERRVEPLRLEWWGPVPYLVAWCTWRRAERVFRIDRIRQLEVLTK